MSMPSAKYNTKRLKNASGQSLIEVLLSVVIGAVFIGAATGALVIALRSSFQNKALRTASSLIQEFLDKVKILSEADWHAIYDLAKSPNQYQVIASDSGLAVTGGAQSLGVDTVNYTRYFTISDVQRDSGGNIVAGGGSDDPSTQFVTVTVSWFQNGIDQNISRSQYLTRSRLNSVFHQTDWSGGGGQTGPIAEVNDKYDVASGINNTFSLALSAPPAAGNLTSSIFDTGVSGGAAVNAVLWQGLLNDGTVKFQIASSNSAAGPWNYVGPDGTNSTYYQPTGPNSQEKITAIDHNNKRYLRYKIFLETGGISPRVDDVIVSYNP